ncbi:MAG: flippase-like domain-containing protein [Kiritimatiellae bacterium]|nr:flippase-like domain-containing protein [Kiritimatiellia bacterium]
MQTLSRALKAIVTIAFFIVLFRWMRRHDWLAALRATDPLYVLLSLLIVPVMLGSSCAKWWVLLRAQGRPVPFRTLLGDYLVGYYFSNLLPSMVGGDAVRVVYSGRRIGSFGHAAAAVFLERFTGILLLLALVVAAPGLRPALYRTPAVWIPSAGAAAVLAGVAIASVGARRLRAELRHWCERSAQTTARPGHKPSLIARFANGADRFLAKLEIGFGVLRRDRRVLAQVVALTLLFYGLAALNVWLAFRSFGPAPSPAEILAVLPTALAVAMIPITLGSLGIAETSYVFYFGLLGISPAHTGVMALFLRLKLILLGVIGGTVYLARDQPIRADEANRWGHSEPSSGAS